jgi:protein-L-isoaspartate(D-aspartate) O-methyltransferase
MKMSEDQESLYRREMVEAQLMRRGITDRYTLDSMMKVPRHRFVPSNMQGLSYDDSPLVIGKGQTISQPYIVALMTQAAECNTNSVVLDIGTGSGYAAAVFAQFCHQVYSIERIPELAEEASQRFEALDYQNIQVKVGDGTLGWKEHAPYDAIVVTAGAPVLPEAMLSQLKVGGRLIIPVGDSSMQKLMRYRKQGEDHHSEELLEYVRFVPLVGEEGWKYP